MKKENMRTALFALFILGFYVFLMSSCFDDSATPSGEVCSSCKTDGDCNSGLKCRGFYNQTGVYNRCASAATQSCPN